MMRKEKRSAKIYRISQIKYFNKERPKRVLMRPWYFAAAASVAILFGLFFFGYNQNPSFNDYNHPEPSPFYRKE